MRINSLCAAPVTVGLFHPVVILPKHWRQWSKAQLGAILTHEGEHVRRRDSLVQWLALLNRALFWFHPAAWWLECTLSALAEEACDDAVLAHGHNPHEYSECLIEMARSVMQSGARVNVAGMAMPGSLLPKRIRKIIEDVPIPRISRARLTCVAVICTIMCSLTVAATLARVPQAATDQPTKPERHFDALQILTPHEGVDFTAFCMSWCGQSGAIGCRKSLWRRNRRQEQEEAQQREKSSSASEFRKTNSWAVCPSLRSVPGTSRSMTPRFPRFTTQHRSSLYRIFPQRSGYRTAPWFFL